MPFTPVKRPSIHLWAQIAFLFFGALVAIAPLVAADDEADSADPAPPAATQNAPSGFSLKPPSGFIGVHYGYAIPRVKSDLFDMVTRELTIKKSQFRSSNSGFDFGITIKPRFVAVVSMDYSRILIDSQIRNAPNSSVVQQTEFKELPISVGVRVYPMKIGVKVGKYAWIQRRIAPYISGGVGFLHYDFNQTGRNVIGQHRPTVFRAPDQVVLEREYGAGVFCIACPHRNNMLQADN